MEEGIISVNMHYNEAYYHDDHATFYYDGDNDGDSGINYTVAIVGWNDSFSKEKFNTPPPGPIGQAFVEKSDW